MERAQSHLLEPKKTEKKIRGEIEKKNGKKTLTRLQALPSLAFGMGEKLVNYLAFVSDTHKAFIMIMG